MKKIIVGLMFLALSGSTFAQDAAVARDFRKHRFGLKVMPGVSYFKIGKIGQERKGIGYYAGGGLNYEYSFGPNIALATGVIFSQTTGGVAYTDSLSLTFNRESNGQVSVDEADQILSRRYVFNSIDIPLKFKFRTPEIGYITYFGEFGVTGSIITKATAKKNIVIVNEGDTETELSGNEEKLDANKETNFFRGGVDFGVGGEYNLAGNTSLLLGLNANLAFTNILKKESESITYRGTNNAFKRAAKINYISLQVGIQF